MSIYLNMYSIVGKGGYYIQGPKEVTELMEQTIASTKAKLNVKIKPAIAAIAVALAIIGTAYNVEDYLDEFETKSQGVIGIEVQLTFSSIEQMTNLFISVL